MQKYTEETADGKFYVLLQSGKSELRERWKKKNITEVPFREK